MSERRRAHGRQPRLGAALRRALDDFERSSAESIGGRLVALGLEPSEAEALVSLLNDHYYDKPDVQTMAWQAAFDAGHDDVDPDALPLIDAITALPEGQRATLSAVIGGACAMAAAEGMLLGAMYVAHEMNGRSTRRQTRPRR